MAAQTNRGVPLSTLCPKYLHSNSTSHTWPFSAIAELIDNAYDPDVSAKQFWIDKTMVQGQECLSFMDNGNGLDYETMHKMLSFGYSDKTAIKGIKPIGMYGNGFKSGSMRLGRDAIVFSKSERASCVGMLSQTYLEEIGANQISVPIVCFEQRQTDKFSVRQEHKASLQDILRYSPFKTEEELLVEVKAISSNWSTQKTGTRIIIWNLRRTSSGTTEFDFEKNRYDIRIPSDVNEEMNDTQHPDKVTSNIPESFYSLRAYCSILYLKPRMQIIIRGQKVNTLLVAKSLALVRKDHYKPTFLNKRIPITFGYNTKSKDQYGIMMYHKNRLIKAYERVGCQLKANNKGVRVIGIIECDFLEPTHNKQSFNETDKYRKTMNNLSTKLEEYWNEMCYKRRREEPNATTPVEDTMKHPDQNWVQCDDCLRWRKLPDGINCSKLPDKWFCRMNPDPQFRSCQTEEEPVDSGDEQHSYPKTYKQQEREDRKIQEKKRQKTAHSPSTPTTLKSRFNTVSPQGAAVRAESSPFRSSRLSQAAGKRTQPASPQTTPKRPKINGCSDTSTIVDVTPQSSPSVLIDNNDDDDSGSSSTLSLDSDKDQTLPNGVTHHLDSDKVVGPPCVNKCDEKDSSLHCPSVTEVQDQQDQLLELMQATAVERDFFKEQVHKLTCQLQDMQRRLEELSRINVKECSHQAIQTEETEEGEDYKALFERAKQKVDELIKDKELLMTASETKTSPAQCEEKDIDDIALQVDCLIYELHTKLDSMEAERANLASECQELRLGLQQERENAKGGSTTPHRTTD
ncbi:MORC family CW-type zinc finger protein 3-like isoform X2 [Anoplopoma fimbria]|uniref:MORC family CW-type zinc finger protein 3-like isoform X2 n=1 Tax=Anoplopoma fimbria TaxID=229290 RepID=UPI0023EDE1AF|nr:MORC family CW-type zinc finger protein 3-like isoform X2 [Anoplopoma fimbria]